MCSGMQRRKNGRVLLSLLARQNVATYILAEPFQLRLHSPSRKHVFSNEDYHMLQLDMAALHPKHVDPANFILNEPL